MVILSHNLIFVSFFPPAVPESHAMLIPLVPLKLSAQSRLILLSSTSHKRTTIYIYEEHSHTFTRAIYFLYFCALHIESLSHYQIWYWICGGGVRIASQIMYPLLYQHIESVTDEVHNFAINSLMIKWCNINISHAWKLSSSAWICDLYY